MLTLSKLKEIEPAIFAGSSSGKKPSPALIASTIKALFKEWKQSPEDINSGECDNFAQEIISRLKYGYAMETVSADEEDYDDDPDEFDEDLTQVPDHAFVQIGDRYYDAEAPHGVKNWWELPVYRRHNFSETNYRPFFQKEPIIGRDNFEEWFNETKKYNKR